MKATQGGDEEIRAAGAVVWRPAGRDVEVAVIHRPKYDDWSFPKGKVDPTEHVLLAAVREVAEETGLAVTLGRNLHQVRYLSLGLPKVVDYWVASARSAAPFVASHEVDEMDWLAASAARSRLSYPHDVDLLDEFVAGPMRTFPLIPLRHAEAGSKADWPGDDLSRPLDSAGAQDALHLADLLDCFGPARVISSTAERCLATIRPYAESIGAQIEVEAAFEVAARGEPGAVSGHGVAAMELLAAADQAVVVCLHRENLPVLLAASFGQLGAEPPAGRPLRKGEFLVLHRAAGKLASVERHLPAAGS